MVTEAVQKLVARSQEMFDAPPSLVEFTGETAAVGHLSRKGISARVSRTAG